MNKKVLRNLSYGVYAVSALGENRMSGCIANRIIQITSSPATLAVSMNHDNYTHECIEKSGMFAISRLSKKALKILCVKRIKVVGFIFLC